MTAEQQAQMGGAPQPGTVEIGGFGQYSFFDDELNLKNGCLYSLRRFRCVLHQIYLCSRRLHEMEVDVLLKSKPVHLPALLSLF